MSYIELCQEAYYKGDPLISNEEYDQLALALGENSIGTAGDIKHYFRMWSLQKVYPCRGDEVPVNLAKAYTETPKLDGCAVSALYFDGKYVRGLTRGDGIQGQDITEKLSLLVPDNITGTGFIQVTGEVATTKEVENQRNFASGALNQKELSAFSERVELGGLVFAAYTIEAEDYKFESYAISMASLEVSGFLTVLPNNEKQVQILRKIPTDGIVYRLSNQEAYESAGSTAKFRKGAFALKEDEEGVWTVLTDVTWCVGKSGKVTPTAIFEPIVIDGATITRATLNNVGYMESLGLTHLGQEICVVRAGKIIPKIVNVKPLKSECDA